MELRSLLGGLGVIVALGLSACGGEEEWVCDGASQFVGVDPENQQTCNVAWSCEGTERFSFVTLQIDCRQEGDVFSCHCNELDPNTGSLSRNEEAFEAEGGICDVSAKTAEQANAACGWNVPEENP